MDIHRLYGLFLPHFRRKRKRLFYQWLTPTPSQRILDVGGYHWFWASMDFAGPVTCLNIDVHKVDTTRAPAQVTYVQGDGRHLPFDEGSFDIAFSNSVIEHVGTWDDQQRFAREIRRVGKAYWVQTPNRWFPVEPHLITPLIHYLPTSLQRRLLRWCTVWGRVTKPGPAEVDGFLAEVRLLTEREVRQLFPDAEILVERFLGFKKSFIAVRRAPVPARS